MQLLSPDRAEIFYSTAAQIIPVLFLAIVFEQKVWGEESGPNVRYVLGILAKTSYPLRWFRVSAGLLSALLPLRLFLGEVLALSAVNGHRSDATPWFVAGALTFGGIVVITPLLNTAVHAVAGWHERRWEEGTRLITAAELGIGLACLVPGIVTEFS